MIQTILILGGYGNAGRLIVDLLLKETKETHIITCGRNLSLAQEQADKLNGMYSGQRVKACQVDASSLDSLTSAFQDIDLVVVASSTTEFSDQVLEAALDANIDYIDIQLGDSVKMEALDSWKSRIESSDRCFVTDGGYHPGLPAALVRYAALQCENLQKANLYAVVQANWKDKIYSKGSVEEFYRQLVDMMASDEVTLTYSKGQWEKQSWWTYRKFDFGETFETRDCFPMFLEEMRELPTMMPTLDEAGLYIAGFDPVTDYCVFPLGLTASCVCPKLARKPMSNVLQWSLKTFASPPYGSAIILDAQGMAKEQENTFQNVNIQISVFHEDEYILTAVPTVACLLQIIDDSVRKPGLHYQAHIVEPNRFFADMKRMGLDINVTVQKVDGTT